MFKLSTTGSNLCPQTKSSMINHLINDRLLHGCLTNVIQTLPQLINISHKHRRSQGGAVGAPAFPKRCKKISGVIYRENM